MARFNTLIILLLALGCTSARVARDAPRAITNASAEQESIKPTAFQANSADMAETETVDAGPEVLSIPEIVADGGLTIEALEQMALANNPAVGQAAANVRALQGKYVQVGLPPNPTMGYVASEVGNDGFAGQQGGFAGQDFITGGKLAKNRAVVAAEIDKAEQVLTATRQRVQTDVRAAYYRALVAQRRVELATVLVEATGKAVKASNDLLEAEEIPVAGLLQTEVEQQNAEVVLRMAENELTAAWQQLSAVVGEVEMPPQKLVGDATALPSELDWQETVDRITMLSPEMAAAVADLSRSRRALNRAHAEPVPDIGTQFMVQYDNSTDNTIAGIQVGIPLPIWNKNQGGIRQAQAEITAASQNIDRVALDLQNRLAVTFREYANARTQAQSYATEILPRADRTFQLVQSGYALGELGYLDLLTAQRTYTQTNLAYLDSLNALWQNRTKIDGLLLEGSLNSSP